MKNITETQISPAVRATRGKDTIGRLFFLEASGGRIHSTNADGSDRKVNNAILKWDAAEAFTTDLKEALSKTENDHRYR